MSPRHEVIKLIGSVYRAVDQPEHWVKFLEELSLASGLKGATLSSLPQGAQPTRIGCWYGIDDALVQEYNERIAATSPYIEPSLRAANPRNCGSGASVLPREELLPTEYFAWLRRAGSNDTLASADVRPAYGMIALAGFTDGDRLVTDEQVDLMSAISPHLFHAVALSRQFHRLGIDARRGRNALSGADFGCAILDARGRVDWLNDASRRMLLREDAIELADETLRARHPHSRQAFESALRAALDTNDSIEAATSEPEFIFEIQRIGEGRPVEVLVSPLRPLGHPLFGEVHGALVMFADPEHLDEGIAGRLQHVYGLTPTEAEVAQWLMAGSSTNDIADIFGNSVHTIRTHLKRVMAKCGASSQVELVGMLQRSLVRLA